MKQEQLRDFNKKPVYFAFAAIEQVAYFLQDLAFTKNHPTAIWTTSTASNETNAMATTTVRLAFRAIVYPGRSRSADKDNRNNAGCDKDSLKNFLYQRVYRLDAAFAKSIIG